MTPLTSALLADDHTKVDGGPLGIQGIAVSAVSVGFQRPDLLGDLGVGQRTGYRLHHGFHPLPPLLLVVGDETGERREGSGDENAQPRKNTSLPPHLRGQWSAVMRAIKEVNKLI